MFAEAARNPVIATSAGGSRFQARRVQHALVDSKGDEGSDAAEADETGVREAQQIGPAMRSRRRVNFSTVRHAEAANVWKKCMIRVVVAIIMFACCGTAVAQTPTATELSSCVDALAQKMLSRPVAGISIAAARDGKVVIARGYG